MAGANWRYSDGQQLPPLSMNLAVRKNLMIQSQRRIEEDKIIVMNGDEQILSLDIDPYEIVKNVKALLEVEYFDLG